MKVTGFTIIKDAVLYDYPVVEAITSILPVCDEFVVALGNSSDETLALIESIGDPKIRIVHTVWNEGNRTGGHVLAEETNKALAAIGADTDWAFYIQADEVVHEQYLPAIKRAMAQYKDDRSIEGLLFNYTHFYGSYDYVGTSSSWYRNEIRIIRFDTSVYSYKDAQGFRKGDNEKLYVKAIEASVYHYGWVKEPAAMQKKQLHFNKYWHDDQWIENHVVKGETFDYSGIDQLALFKGTHPQVMLRRIKAMNWSFDFDLTFNKTSLKERGKAILRKWFGLDFSYKNYRLR
jgi:glycosyltransferase involved in cell wall biosynthesis